MSNSSPVINTANLAFVESLYGRFLEDPTSVPEDFRRYFESEHPAAAGVRIGPSFSARSLFDSLGSVPAAPPATAINGSHARPARATNGTNGTNGHVNGNGAAALSNGNGSANAAVAYANGALAHDVAGARANGLALV